MVDNLAMEALSRAAEEENFSTRLRMLVKNRDFAQNPNLSHALRLRLTRKDLRSQTANFLAGPAPCSVQEEKIVKVAKKGSVPDRRISLILSYNPAPFRTSENNPPPVPALFVWHNSCVSWCPQQYSVGAI